MSETKPGMQSFTGKDVYVSIENKGYCKICLRVEDLRYGACFDCADNVKGEDLGNGLCRLWDKDNPRNEWLVSENGQ